MPQVTLRDGATIFYRDDCFADPWRDDVETVVMMHGFCRNSTFWTGWVAPLARRYRVLRWDARGTGESTKTAPPGGWTLRGYHDDLLEYLDAAGVQSAHFVGESMGGMVMPYVATWSPQRVRSFTAVSSNVGIRGAVAQQMAAGATSMPDAIRSMSLDDYIRATENGRLDPGETSQAMRDWFRAAWAATPRSTWEEWSSILVPQIDITPELLAAVACPVFVIAASGSSRTPVEEVAFWKEHARNATMATVEARSQGIAFAKPDECAALTLDFLSTLAPRAVKA
jgi:3-oxoadipate enol-lactonase